MYVTSGKEFLLALHSARRPQVSFEGGANRRSLDLNLSYVDGLYLEPADPRAVFIYLVDGEPDQVLGEEQQFRTRCAGLLDQPIEVLADIRLITDLALGRLRCSAERQPEYCPRKVSCAACEPGCLEHGGPVRGGVP